MSLLYIMSLPLVPITIIAGPGQGAKVTIAGNPTEFIINDLSKPKAIQTEFSKITSAYADIKNTIKNDEETRKLITLSTNLDALKTKCSNYARKPDSAKKTTSSAVDDIFKTDLDEITGLLNSLKKPSLAADAGVKFLEKLGAVLKADKDIASAQYNAFGNPDSVKNIRKFADKATITETGDVNNITNIEDFKLYVEASKKEAETAAATAAGNVVATADSEQVQANLDELNKIYNPVGNPFDNLTPEQEAEIEKNKSEALNSAASEGGGAASELTTGGKRRRKTNKRKRAQNRKGRRTMNRRWY